MALAVLASCPAWASNWRQDIYVWQRQWSPAVNSSLASIRSSIDTVHLLAAEVTGRAGRTDVFRAQPDYRVLKESDFRVGLVLRIGPYGGSFSAETAIAEQVVALATELLAEARAAGVEPVELQIDFDCAESKLEGYREWLRLFRTAAGATRLTFTALPAWLRQPEAFRALAQTADGFVLQVHSLDRPNASDARLMLCDPECARAWAEQASLAGRPFLIALPTHGYEVAFDRKGRFAGLAAEGPRREWPEGITVRAVRSDAKAMAELARSLSETPPEGCKGLVWFRLPVAGDRLNWSLRTLAVIAGGGVPRGRLSAIATTTTSDPRLAEIAIENTGDLTEELPACVEIKWPEDVRPASADSLAGYRLVFRTRAGGADLVRTHVSSGDRLPPGGRVRVGWIRFAHETSIQVNLSPFTPSR